MKKCVWFLPFLLLMGCGTDLKPSAFVDVLRDPTDIDELSVCLSEAPTITDEEVTITLEKQCLVDFSNEGTVDPNLAPSFADIVANPEVYMDRVLTFQAVVKGNDVHHVALYTNDKDLDFHIHKHGVNVYYLDADGEEVQIDPHRKYRFTVLIYQLEKNVEWGSGKWQANAKFIASEDKKLMRVPELVE